MAGTLFDADELLRRPPAGSLRPVVVFAVLASCFLTVVVTAVGGDSLLGQLEWSGNAPVMADVLTVIAPLVMFAALVAALLLPTRARVSRLARTAVLLPFAHLAIIVGAGFVYTRIDSELLHRDMPMLDTLPILPTFFALALLLALAARFIARRREQMHGLVMISLAFLFALGMWLPIASRLWAEWGMSSAFMGSVYEPGEYDIPSNGVLAVCVIGVPFIVACAYTVFELRLTNAVRRWRPVLAVVAVGMLLGGTSARYSAAHGDRSWSGSWSDASQNVYANFMHVLLIAVVLAFVALAAFVFAQRRGKARDTVLRRGTVRVSNPDADSAWRTPIGSVEITSWLRPPRTAIGAFTLVTEHGDIPIPAGGTLGGALPLATTILFNGEAVVVLRDGDDVVVEGLVEENAGESPFRSASMLVPGPAGVIVRAPRLETRGATVLALWRPSLAYMAIAAAVAISAIAGAS